MTRIATLLWFVLVPVVASAADPLIGQEVFPKGDAKPRVGNREVDFAWITFPSTVLDVKGEWLWLGRAWVRRSDVYLADQAIAGFTEDIREEPTNPATWNNRALTWEYKGENDNAIKDYTEALRLDPSDEFVYYNRGVLWERKGERDIALKDLSEAIRLNPKYASPYSVRGLVWQEKGEFANAIKDYTEAMRLDPGDSVAYRYSAWLRATCPDERFRDGKKAITNATIACELTLWKDWDRIDTLAAAYAEAGDFESAVKWQEKVIAMVQDQSAKDKANKRLELYKAGKPYRSELKH